MDQENIPIGSRRRNMSAIAKLNPLHRSDTVDNEEETLQLPSPPSSQMNLLDVDFRSMRASSSEASKSLISPPPEEFLRQTHVQRFPAQAPFTPSLLANSYNLPSTSKRKRTVVSTTSSTSSVNSSHSTQALEATPNPKPRKQTRRHTRTPSHQSIDSDTAMDSPLPAVGQRRKPLRIASPVDEVDTTEHPEHTPSPQTTPTHRQRSSPIRRTSTTPTRSRTVSPRTSPSKPRRSYLQSPHAKNPEADYIPPVPVEPLTFDNTDNRKSFRRARRSVTPVVPPYEPPPDVFTPPKLVVLSPPTQTQPRSRSAKPRASRARSSTPKVDTSKPRKKVTGILTVKTEMPDIDLRDPAPPASPTDDPLLLSGPIDVPSSSRSRSGGRSRNYDKDEQLRTPVKSKGRKHVTIALLEIPAYKSRISSVARSTSPSTIPRNLDSEPRPTPARRPAIPDDLPASSPLPSSDDEAPGDVQYDIAQETAMTTFDLAETSTDMDMDGGVLPIFNFDLNAGDTGFSDSDDDLPDANSQQLGKTGVVVGEGEGEYTGRWRLLTVPTKNDPPSSATRERMDRWGRPISPFPKKVRDAVDHVEPLDDVQGQTEERDLRLEQDHSEPMASSAGEEQAPGIQQDEGGSDSRILESTPAGAFDFDTSFEEDTRLEPEATHAPHQEESMQEVIDEHGLEEDTAMEDSTVQAGGGAQEADEGELDDDRQASLPIAINEQVAEPLRDAEGSHLRKGDQAPGELCVIDEDEKPQSDGSNPRNAHFNETEELSMPTAPKSDLDLSPARRLEVHNHTPEDYEIEVESATNIAEAEVSAVTNTQASTHYHNPMDDPDTGMDAIDHGESEESDAEVGDTSLIEITSADPRAAARAAAILKQHDYEFYTRVVLQQRQKKSASRSASPATFDDISRNARRRSISAGGVSKSTSPRPGSSRGLSPGSPAVNRRRTIGGMIGDAVIIPGSSLMTLPELLEEAEKDLRTESVCGSASKAMGKLSMESPGGRDPYSTPCPSNRRYSEAVPVHDDNGAKHIWTKDDWKRLDSCFTDERLELGATLALAGSGHEEVLADVDDVSLEDVVNRFIDLMGGEDVVQAYGDGWTRDNLLRRARALRDKQRKGHVPPPTIPAHVRTPSPFTFGKPRSASIEVPDFTPAASRYAPRLHGGAPSSNDLCVTQSPLPVSRMEPLFQNIPPEKPRKLPATLLAPRYSHLLEEAIAISQPESNLTQDPLAQEPEALEADNTEYGSPEPEFSSVHDPTTPYQPMSMGKRVKGILFSYLPSLSRTAPNPSRPKKGVSGLPLPPPDLVAKQRKPIITPIRPPPPKPAHPKDLVNLNHAPPPLEKKPSLIPRREKPKRLVELHPVSPPETKPEPIAIPRPRRSSGGSVKDLVKSFEDMEKDASRRGGISATVKKVRSISELRKGKDGNGRPVWKP